MSKFYINTAIAYVNGKPHVGHALEFIFADIIARYYRLKGDDVRLCSGTDEFGSKIFKMSEELGIDTQELVDQNVGAFKDIWQLMNGSNDDFIRTTSDMHQRGAQKLWNRLVEAGDIYEDEYDGLYCVGCESNKQLHELVDGKCPNHNKEPEKIKEKNYFFRLSKYNDQLKKMIESDELKIYPDSKKKEMLSLLDQGLIDVSFSRSKDVMPWGVEVPGDPEQVMYVWCDALSNYLTALGYADDDVLVEKYWPSDIVVIGKDILRFHAGIWPAMLISAGLPVHKSLGVHGFVTCEGQKMSKSLGNVVDPVEIIEKYGSDAVRYYFAREIPTGDDGDYSEERFGIVYASELANNFGNLVNRVVVMIGKYLEGRAPEVKDFVYEKEFAAAVEVYQASIENFDLKKALEEVVKLLNLMNAYVEETKPWSLAKESPEKLPEVLGNMLEGVRRCAVMLWPYIPDASEKIFDAFGFDLEMDLEKSLDKKVEQGTQIENVGVLFPRLEEA